MHVDAGKARDELREAGRYMLAHELAWGNAGNLSVRIAPDRYMITASGTRLGELAVDDFAECRLATPFTTGGGPRPSKERPMHEAIYETRPEINAVLHASPFYSTLIACTVESVPANLFVESMYYLERVARVPYRGPGSDELGEVVRVHAAEANVLLLENHGVLVYDTSVREALMSLQTLEMTCRMWLTARGAGVTMRELEPDVAQHFLVHAGYKPRREWP